MYAYVCECLYEYLCEYSKHEMAESNVSGDLAIDSAVREFSFVFSCVARIISFCM